MNLDIRIAEKSDIDSMISLMDYLLSLEGDFPNQRENQQRGFELALDSETTIYFVAELDSVIVGMCCLHKFVSTVQGVYTGVVEDVVVIKEHGGKGIGKKLLNYLEDYSKKTGLTRLALMVDKGNSPAISLYKKQGWEETKYLGFRKYL
ncbi:MAG: GNAT family N-acetyltransferase [Denitrovibrio sp.]|nr:MAG: GNAT family N-acetyltransferase [Denitrovibrio sp.]